MFLFFSAYASDLLCLYIYLYIVHLIKPNDMCKYKDTTFLELLADFWTFFISVLYMYFSFYFIFIHGWLELRHTAGKHG